MKQKTIVHKSAFSDFKILYSHYSGKSKYEHNSISKAKEDITCTYGLDGSELILISLLAQLQPKKGILCESISPIFRSSDEVYYKSMVDSLRNRNFIRKDYTSSGQAIICLSDRAIEAFKTYESLGPHSYFNFVEELRHPTPFDFPGFTLALTIKYELLTHPSSSFSISWASLGADTLNENEIRSFLKILTHFVNNFTIPMGKKKDQTHIVGMNINDIDDEDTSDQLKNEMEPLIQKGLVIIYNDGYVIAPKVAEALFHGHDEIVKYDDISQKVTVIKSCFIEKKELFFSSESQEEIDNLHFMLSKEGYEHACSVLTKKKRNPSIQSLLWGGPGTGKTETVKQIALETGRDIFLFDAAKVTASEWGSTEKLYREMFLAYRFIVAIKSLTPILLINEADQILSKRLEMFYQSIDKSMNIISDIILQEMEDMSGILLATTNNIKLLDEAFDRRFLFKTELQKPDVKARELIWKSTIPELTEYEAKDLAERYELSGAQINNVATKRDLAEIYFFGDRGIPYIEALCNKELDFEKLIPTRKHIGFQ